LSRCRLNNRALPGHLSVFSSGFGWHRLHSHSGGPQAVLSQKSVPPHIRHFSGFLGVIALPPLFVRTQRETGYQWGHSQVRYYPHCPCYIPQSLLCHFSHRAVFESALAPSLHRDVTYGSPSHQWLNLPATVTKYHDLSRNPCILMAPSHAAYPFGYCPSLKIRGFTITLHLSPVASGANRLLNPPDGFAFSA